MTSSLLLVLLLSSPLVMAVAGPGPQPKPSDTDALTIFRSRTDTHGNLAANWSTHDACTGRWRGVGCSGGRVTSLVLPFLDLRGPLAPLSHLDQLRRLDLHGNRLNGTLLPLIPALPNLKLLYLFQNDLSGEIPPAVGRLTRLLRLDLSSNDLRGPIPGDALANLTRLLTLRLQNNLLSGRLPDLSAALPHLVEFNASNNNLYGRVPDGMHTRFGTASFAGNAGLCGPAPPLPPCSFMPRESPPSSSSPQSVVPSNPSTRPSASSNAGAVIEGRGEGERRNGEGLSRGTIVGIAVGNAVFLLVVLSLLCGYLCCVGHLGDKDVSKIGGVGREGDYPYTLEAAEEEKQRKKGGRDSDGGESDEATARQSKLVFFEEEEVEDGSGGKRGRRKRGSKRFELEELLRASAEMLGKGSLGTVYRAVLEDGCMVAVKRLKDANPCARADFHKYMDLIGRLRRPNLVRLRAYYYAKQEKLLIYDYLPNGSLHSRLHGNRAPGRIPLDWTTRISLVLGAARGLACIHEEYASSKIPHGNVKSSNVLLDKNGASCVADFGLALLLSPAHATARLGGYRAPEQTDTRRLSQEADVYAFGVLILEVLTGRAPALYPLPRDPDSHHHHNNNNSITNSSSNSIIGVSLPEWVRSVVREEWTAEVFDAELLRYKNIEEEMVAMLHVGLACVAHQPDRRPAMSEVVKMIEDIRVEQSPLPEEDFDESRVSLSPSLATATEDGRLSY